MFLSNPKLKLLNYGLLNGGSGDLVQSELING